MGKDKKNAAIKWKACAAIFSLCAGMLFHAVPPASADSCKAATVRGDYETAYRLCLPLAENGDALAQGLLGWMYENGEGVRKDYQRAARWYRKAADQGNASVQVKLGLMYDEGKGVPKDYQEAAYWYRKAADQGEARAQFNLGIMYLKGDGVPKDYQQALRWFRKAADQGEARAQYNLGVMYDFGKGVPKDYQEAYKWYSLAGAKGHKSARHNLNLLERSITGGQIAEGQRLARNWKPGASSDAEKSPGKRPPSGNGSGFLVSDKGHILTNEHVVSDCRSFRVSPPGDPAILRGRDKANDLALLQVPPHKSMRPVSFQERSAQLGSDVLAVGYPLRGKAGRGLNITKGTISALSDGDGDSRLLQFTAPVQPGNSGGPLLDESGLVVGVIVSRLEETAGGRPVQNVNFAIRAKVARAFLDSNSVLYESGKGGWLSPKAETVAENARAHTVMVECYQ